MNIEKVYNVDRPGNDCFIYESWAVIEDMTFNYVLHHTKISGFEDTWQVYTIAEAQRRLEIEVLRALGISPA